MLQPSFALTTLFLYSLFVLLCSNALSEAKMRSVALQMETFQERSRRSMLKIGFWAYGQGSARIKATTDSLLTYCCCWPPSFWAVQMKAHPQHCVNIAAETIKKVIEKLKSPCESPAQTHCERVRRGFHALPNAEKPSELQRSRVWKDESKFEVQIQPHLSYVSEASRSEQRLTVCSSLIYF